MTHVKPHWLVWMYRSPFSIIPFCFILEHKKIFHSRSSNTKINNLHERCQLIHICDRRWSYAEFLEKGGSVFIHHRNIQVIAKERCKVKNASSPKIFTELFCQKEITSYNLRTEYHSEGLYFMGSKLSHLLVKKYGIFSRHHWKKLIPKLF